MTRPVNYWVATIVIGITWGVGAGIVVPQGAVWWHSWVIFAVSFSSFSLGRFTR